MRDPFDTPAKRVLPLVALALFAAVLAVATIATAVLPDLRFSAEAPGFDVVINQTAFVASIAAAWLAWLRFRVIGEASAIFQSSAFVVLAAASGLQVAGSVGIGAEELGFARESPSQAPIYAWTVSRILAGLLLLWGARVQLRRARAVARWRSVLIVPSTALLVSWLLLYALESQLPVVVDRASLQSGGPVADPRNAAIVAAWIAIQVGSVLVMFAAAVGYGMAATARLAPSSGYLAAGLVAAAFSQVHFALHPGIHTPLVTTSDILRLAFYLLVVIGIGTEIAAALHREQQANLELARTRDADIAQSTTAERLRLAREMHDGLVQYLWLAKLSLGRLAEAKDREEAGHVEHDLHAAIDAGIAEARQAIDDLRAVERAGAPLSTVVKRLVDSFAAQTGLDVRLTIDDGGASDALPPRVVTEFIGIVREALSNVWRHADATVVVVEITRQAKSVAVTVRDNGVGFEPSRPGTGPGLGLQGMHERASLLDGSFSVSSKPHAGTSVHVSIPLVA